ncbi:MAG: SUMF1/EgtB/PvdO family nonheme iron enzyme [Caldilineaceae bacterium]
MPLDYLDFELEIGQLTGQEYPLTLLRSPAGEARATLLWPLGELALENRRKDLQIALLSSGGVRRTILTPAEAAVQRFGAELFDLLFSGEVRNRYDVSQERVHHQGKGLRVKLRIQDPLLANLPWEFLYDPRRGEYICLSQQTPLVRYLELPQTIRPLAVTPPLRILGLIASPSDLQTLDVRVERQRLERAIAPLQAEGLVELQWLPGAGWRDLQRALRREPWHIFHFVGHGDFDPRREEGLIALCTPAGKAHHFSAGDLGRLLADHRTLRLAVLNACLGAQGSNHDLFSSTAATLVRRGLPAVVAMQEAITDAAAIEFTQSFYESLADGLPVDAAMSEARKAISFAVTNTLEWGTPVLYSRASDGVLFNVASLPEGEPAGREGNDRAAPSENLPGKGDSQVRNPEKAPAPSRKMADAPPATRDAPSATPNPGDKKTITAAGVPFIFVYVPAGPFRMGSEKYDREKPAHTFTTDAYWLLQTPVTNGHYQPFVKAGGYTNQEWWTPAGWQWRTKEKITEPRYWQDSQWNEPKQPVVGVSWYEALAFANWLTQLSGEAIRLPTEAEWEKGARGEDGREYPWGDQAPDKTLCNIDKYVGKTTPVDAYPKGASPYGALDMAGNVWEWTLTKWLDNYENYANLVDNRVDADADARRVVRGGSWSSFPHVARATFRIWDVPADRDDNLGFRLVVVLAPR